MSTMPSDSEADESSSPELDKDSLKGLPRNIGKRASAIVSFAVGLVALWKAAQWIWGQKAVQWIWDQIRTLPLSFNVVVGSLVLLSLAALLLLWQVFQNRFGTKSSFKHPEVFSAARKYHLRRDQDVDNVLDLLRDSPLVFLVGESGAGKTTFLKPDLLERLAAGGAYFPIYLDRWGVDWADGPRNTLALALSEDRSLRNQLGLAGATILSQEALKIVELIHDKLGKIPVLLFDQFDDYYIEHRDQFVRGQERRHILEPGRLIEENPFWREVAGLLGAGKVRCLFAVRDDDAHLALTPVTFPGQQARTYHLELLAGDSASALLAELARKAGVRHPQAGFDALHKRLIADLGGKYHVVLPAQMNLAFRGLAWFDPLTLGHYVKAGSLRGMIAVAVEHAVAQAARLVPCEPGELRPLLLALVDPGTQSRVVPRTEGELLDLLPAAIRDPAKLGRALSSLRGADIVRRSAARDGNERLWQLDHAYLCPVLAEIDRPKLERRWQQLLDDAAGTFAAATGPRGRWRALLRPGAQIRIAYERLRGRLSYGAARGFALRSTPRLLLNPLVVAFVLLLFAWRQVVTGRIHSGETLGFAVDNSGFIQSGLVTCWGNNDSSQVAPSPLPKFFQVTAGGSHSCGLKADDLSVICWGDPASPQVKDTPRGSFYQVNAGGSHACGLKTNHKIVCWGDNKYGQTGPAPDAKYYSQVSAGQVHSCGRTIDGSIVCWGANSKPWTAPPGHYTQVSAAISPDAYSCGLKDDGSVACWTPSGESLPPIPDRYLGISAAESHTCGLKTDRRITCWYNYSRQPWGAPGNDTYTHVSTGKDHACGLKHDGSLFCWADDNSFHKKQPLPTGSYFHVASGSSHSCALRQD
jgi:hypothetical protein